MPPTWTVNCIPFIFWQCKRQWQSYNNNLELEQWLLLHKVRFYAALKFMLHSRFHCLKVSFGGAPYCSASLSRLQLLLLSERDLWAFKFFFFFLGKCFMLLLLSTSHGLNEFRLLKIKGSIPHRKSTQIVA